MELCKFNWVTDHLPEEEGFYICITCDKLGKPFDISECMFSKEFDAEGRFYFDWCTEREAPANVLAWAEYKLAAEIPSPIFEPYPDAHLFTELYWVSYISYEDSCASEELFGYMFQYEDHPEHGEGYLNSAGTLCYPIIHHVTLSIFKDGELVDAISFNGNCPTDFKHADLLDWLDNRCAELLPDLYKSGMIYPHSWKEGKFLG